MNLFNKHHIFGEVSCLCLPSNGNKKKNIYIQKNKFIKNITSLGRVMKNIYISTFYQRQYNIIIIQGCKSSHIYSIFMLFYLIIKNKDIKTSRHALSTIVDQSDCRC